MREEVFRRAAGSGNVLLSLKSNEMTLEQIFLRLTENADNDTVRRLLGAEETNGEENE